MIRFEPDTWTDALLRPIAMAAPDGGVYIEVMAPDLRFAALMLLTGVALLFWLRGHRLSRPLTLLLAFVWLAFVPWLLTSGNGRYFLPVLMLAGPVCLGLIWRLPGSASLRVVLGAVLLAMQAGAVVLNDPRGVWGLVPWADKYYDVALTQRERDHPAAYVLISSISYSLLAPQFDAESRWIGVGALSGGFDTQQLRAAQAALTRAQHDGLPLRLLVPTLPDYMGPDRQPNAQLRREMDRTLGVHRLALDARAQCYVLPSRSLAMQALGNLDRVPAATSARFGFWECPLRYPVQRPPAAPAPDTRAVDRIFDRLEQACPRWFPPGTARTVRLPDGFFRSYPDSDFKAYVMDDGQVWYRYWRALNANAVGTRSEVLADSFRLDCSKARGRAGLPWDRVL